MRFRDLSLKMKMFITLTVFFLLPLTTVGFFFSFYSTSINVSYETERGQDLIDHLSQELSETFYAAENIPDGFMRNGWLWKFSIGAESRRDYFDLANWYQDYARNRPGMESFDIIRDNIVLFERGAVSMRGVMEEVDGIEAYLLENSSAHWSLPHELQTFKGDNPTVLTYSYSYGSRSTPLLLRVNINEENITDSYLPYLAESSLQSFIVNSSGVVLSASDKSMLGNVFPEHTAFSPKMVGNSGNFQANYNGTKIVVFYSQLGKRDWYLINYVPVSTYKTDQAANIGIIFLAAGMGVIFALLCLVIQQRYIIHPLDNILREMDQFREGSMSPSLAYDSKDEIGQMSRQMDRTFQRINELINEVYINKIHNQEATLKMLTSQINPHFLYNTLDSIHWLAVKNKDYEVGDQLEMLSDLFRHVLSKPEDMVPLREELAQIENYLSIMIFRYGNRLHLHMNVDSSLNDILVPKLIIQPLVENAILHGIEPKVEGGCVIISVQKEKDFLVISVEDNGAGADEVAIHTMLENGEENHNVFALKNLDQRIKLHYGSDYGLVFRSVPGKGTLVRVTIPRGGKQ